MPAPQSSVELSAYGSAASAPVRFRGTRQTAARLRVLRSSALAGGPIGHAFRELRQAEMTLRRLERHLERPEMSRKERRRSRAELAQARDRHQVVERQLAAVTLAETARLDEEDHRLDARLPGLRTQSAEYGAWIDCHPEAARRLDHLSTEIDVLDQRLDRSRGVTDVVVGLGRDGPLTRPPIARELDSASTCKGILI